MSVTMPDNYHNRFSTDKRWEEVLFVSGRYSQSAEANEVQSILSDRMRRVTDAIFKDGDVVRAASIAVNQNTGHVRMDVGSVYILGGVRTIDAREFDIAVVGTVKVGVWVTENVITELQEPELRGPTTGLRGQGQAGAARRVYTMAWGKDTDTPAPNKTFYPVYNVVNATVLDQKAPPSLDAVTNALAVYDYDANKNYIVRGNTVTPLGFSGGSQTFSVREGVANVLGYKLTRQTSFRLVVPEEPELFTVNSEPHVFADGGAGTMTIPLNRGPVDSIQQVVITAEKTVTITKGAAGGSDPLPDTSVAQIMSVKVGGTTYTQGTDYTLGPDAVNWAPPGAEPSPGASVTVVYRYLRPTTWGAVGRQNVVVSGAVTGSTVLVNYKYKLARIDAVVMDRYGDITLYKGVASQYRPQVPRPPDSYLVLALVTNDWGLMPTVLNNGIRAIPMGELEAMRQNIYDLYDLISQERLLRDVSAKEPVAKRGLFVDPFLDDNLRDEGVPQTATISNGELSLSLNVGIVDLGPSNTGQGWQLAYTTEPIIVQDYETGWSKINPYQAFDPIPASLSLNPNVDAWVEYDTEYLSPVTRQLTIWLGPITQSLAAVTGNWNLPLLLGVVQENNGVVTGEEVVGTRTQQISPYMRSRVVNFTLAGFEPGEAITTMKFDNLPVTPTAP